MTGQPKRQVRTRVDHKSFSLAVRRKDAQVKSHTKAKMLREYSKLCAREGVVSDRVRSGPKLTEEASSERVIPAKTSKSNPFEKQILIAQARVNSKQQSTAAHSKLPDASASKDRRAAKRQSSAVNSKGQPVLKHKIMNMLSKLQPK